MRINIHIYKKEKEVLGFLKQLQEILGKDVIEIFLEEMDEDLWTEDEIKEIGKLAFHPKNFDFGDQDEDYSQW